MTVPAVEGLLAEPYVTLAEFKTAPTWMDVDDLVQDGDAQQQDSELYNVLLRASAWVDNWCGQRLGAHVATENTRAQLDKYGRAYIHPSNVPVRQVTGIAYGPDYQNLQLLTDLSQVWVEDARGIVVSVFPMRANFAGTLEFGSARPNSEVYVQYQYVAGYASTVLAADAAEGATEIEVEDATGLQPPSTTILGAIGGSTARLWDPNLEEAVSVASGYTAGNTTVPLASPLKSAHAAGTSVSELPAEIHQATICFAVALMMREDVAADEPFSNTPYGPATRQSAKGGPAAGLLDTAYELLEPYRRVR